MFRPGEDVFVRGEGPAQDVQCGGDVAHVDRQRDEWEMRPGAAILESSALTNASWRLPRPGPLT